MSFRVKFPPSPPINNTSQSPGRTMSNTLKCFTDEDANRIKKSNLRAMILELIKISTIPVMMKKVMEVTEDPRAGVSDLEKVIEHDPAIASRIVAVSNAVFYGFPRKINSISQAILVLGFDMVKGLAISTTVFNISHPRAGRQLAAIWGHSFECAMASIIIARKTGLVTKESAFLAGLLHDIGKPIMVQACGETYLEALFAEGGAVQGEEETFGASHAEAGAWFADKCKLPEDCVAAIRHHHRPQDCIHENTTPPVLVLATYLADILASGVKPQADDAAFTAVLKALGLTEDDFEGVRAEFQELKVQAPAFA